MSTRNPKPTRRWDVRRILLSHEVEQIRPLQVGAPEFERNYPRHEAWLEMAIQDVIAGARIAFGVFSLGFDQRNRPVVDLAGCTILKPRRYSEAIEMKNLYVKEDARKQGMGKELYNATEEYCARSGYSVIEVETPCREINTVGFLHSMGYRVTEMVHSPYRPGEHVYRMRKSLPPRYRGDNYDLYAVARWFVKQHYGVGSISEVKPGSSFRFDLAGADHPQSRISEELDIRGAALVLDGDDEADPGYLAREIEKRHGDLLLVFGEQLRERHPEALGMPGVKAIDAADIFEVMKGRVSYRVPRFPRSEIRGMIVSVNPDFFRRIAEAKGDSFAFFKSGPVGKYLGPGHTILFYVEPTSAHPQGGLQGSATVQRVVADTPARAWTALQGPGAIFTDDEYRAFTRNKQEVVAMALTGFRRVEPVELDRVTDELPDPVDLGHYYLDAGMVRRFSELARPVAEEGGAPALYDVVLSFAGEDKGPAADLSNSLRQRGVKVFNYLERQSSLFGTYLPGELERVIRDEADFCVVLISRHYAGPGKPMITQELQTALSRRLREKREFLLPVRLDDTALPGLNDDIAFLDLRTHTAEQVGQIIADKLQAHKAAR